jgi:hypothetical protein
MRNVPVNFKASIVNDEAMSYRSKSSCQYFGAAKGLCILLEGESLKPEKEQKLMTFKQWFSFVIFKSITQRNSCFENKEDLIETNDILISEGYRFNCWETSIEEMVLQ